MELPPECIAIAEEITDLEQSVQFFQIALKELAPSGKAMAVRFIKELRSELDVKRQELSRCRSLPLPDLIPKRFGLIDNGGDSFFVHMDVENIGSGSANGPFKALAAFVDVRTNQQQIIIWQIPDSVSIVAGETFQSSASTIPISLTLGGGASPIYHNILLRVDIENTLDEENKKNNSLLIPSSVVLMPDVALQEPSVVVVR